MLGAIFLILVVVAVAYGALLYGIVWLSRRWMRGRVKDAPKEGRRR